MDTQKKKWKRRKSLTYCTQIKWRIDKNFFVQFWVQTLYLLARNCCDFVATIYQLFDYMLQIIPMAWPVELCQQKNSIGAAGRQRNKQQTNQR